MSGAKIELAERWERSLIPFPPNPNNQSVFPIAKQIPIYAADGYIPGLSLARCREAN